jgi:hypothetical protein
LSVSDLRIDLDAELTTRLRLGVTRLARKLRQQAEPGITPSLLMALSSIERHGRITMGELCAVEQVQPPSMTRIRRRKEAYLSKRLRSFDPHELTVLQEAVPILERLVEGGQ